MLRYLPNLITGLRFLLVLPIVSAFLKEDWRLAFYLFLIASLSDGIDGLLARCYGWITPLGAMLDPIADKLLLISSFVTFSWLSKLPWWLTGTVIARDLWIIVGALVYRFWIGPLYCQPIWVSKLNTALQLLLILLLLIHLGFYALPLSSLYSTGVLMLITSVVSFVQYTWLWSLQAWRAACER